MLYVNISSIFSRLATKSVSISSMSEINNIANGVTTVSASNLIKIIDVLGHIVIAKSNFVTTMTDALSIPPSIKIKEFWNGPKKKTYLEFINDQYKDHFSGRRARIIMGNVLRFLGTSVNFTNSDVNTNYPSNANLFYPAIPLTGTNNIYYNALLTLLNPVVSAVSGFISMVEVYDLIIKLINRLNPIDNLMAFQILDSTNGITGLYTKSSVITQLNQLKKAEEGGYYNTSDNKYYTSASFDELTVYSQLVDEVVYLTNISTTLNLSILNSTWSFLGFIDEASFHLNTALSNIQLAHTSNNNSNFVLSKTEDANFLSKLRDAHTAAITALGVTDEYMIPYYAYLSL